VPNKSGVRFLGAALIHFFSCSSRKISYPLHFWRYVDLQGGLPP